MIQENEDLFSRRGSEPLAARMRPETLDEYIGQEEILGKGKLLRRAIEADRLSSILLWGPPGSGKTTLGYVVAKRTDSRFLTINAVLAGVKDIRQAIATAKEYWDKDRRKSILFIDEVHRFNKSQQDALLPHVENGTIILIGATTENPYFEVNKPLVSRSRVFELKPLDIRDIKLILQQALANKQRGYGRLKINISDDALYHLSDVAQGDARSALNALELAVETTSPSSDGIIQIDRSVAEESIQRRALLYDKDGDVHYDTISAFIKSLRGSDPDAALYWMARMLYSGENPRFIARRMVIFASEDVGMADPSALQVATAAAAAVEFVGMPECQFNLSQACIHLATAEKSNSTMAYFDALKKVENKGIDEVPNHLKDSSRDKKGLGHGKGYKYPHAYRDHWTPQQYLPDKLEGNYFYHPSGQGFESEIRKRLAGLKEKKGRGYEELTESNKQGRKEWEAWQKKIHSKKTIQRRDLVLCELKLKEDDAVLELGTGDLFSWSILGKIPFGSTLSFFSTQERLKEFERERRKWKVDCILRAVSGDMCQLPFQAGSFDIILSLCPFAKSNSFETFLSETVRVLKKGGRFYFFEALPSQRKRLWQEVDFGDLSQELVERIIVAEESLYSIKDGIFALDVEAIKALLVNRGFEILSFDLGQEEEQISITGNFLKLLFDSGNQKDPLSYGDRLRKTLSAKEFDQAKRIIERELGNRTINRTSVYACVAAALK